MTAGAAGVTVGRYKDVAKAAMPGELPPEGRPGRRRVPQPAAAPVFDEPEDRRRYERLQREAAAVTMARGRDAGQAPDIRHGSLPDPNTALRGKRQRAAVNLDTDALEREYGNGRISDAAYLAGRTYGRVLERSRRPISAAGGWNPGDKVDHADSHEAAIAGRIEAAKQAVAMVRETAPVLGAIAGRVLELTLVDGLTLTAVAQALRGRGDRQDVIYYSALFRDSLEALATHWASKGRAARTPFDKHRQAAVGLEERESASIEAGTTLGRLQDELAALLAAPRPSEADRAEARLLTRRILALLYPEV